MKKYIVLLTVSLLVIMSATAVLAGNGQGAIVVRIDDICWMDITTEDTGENYLASGDLHYVETPEGLWILTCQGEIYEQTAPLDEAYNERSTAANPTISCTTPWDVTYDTHVTLTPAGQAHFTCQGDLTPSGVNNDFVAYPNNPVLELGNQGEWDGGTIVLPEVIVVGDTFHMFYTGLITAFSSAPAIGYASSPDGLTWTKSISNPILVGDGTGFDAYYVATPAMLYDDGLWVMYYAGQPTPPPAPSGSQIGRATAPAPAGPWTKGTEPVLSLGSSGEWDSGFIEANTVLKIDNEYVMYYSGGADFFSGAGFMIGRATSPDGLTWTKYDDPATTEAPFAESDPVLMPGAAGAWDEAMVWESTVRHTPCGWEMYYTGAPSFFESAIGYATSEDGLVWVKDPANPIYEAADDPVTASTGNVVEVPTVIDVGNERWMYYDYGQGDDPPAVGLAKAPLACR